MLAEFASDGQLDAEHLDQLRSAFILDIERTIDQDPRFGIRQLVDIALKALSPAISDPTTAEDSLSHLGDALGRLCRRPFPSNERVGVRGGTRYVFSRPTWEDFVDAAFAQIRRQAADNVHVTTYLLRVLHELARCVPPDRRGLAIRHEVDEICHVLDRGTFSPADTAALRRQADQVEEALSSPVPEPAL